ITPGASTHSAATVAIQGSNTEQLNPTVAVNSPDVATISVANSPLAIEVSGATGFLTITNNSLLVTAENITADFSGTDLDGKVSETGNTCATLAPQASCTLTFTSAAALQAQTSFPIN